MNEPTPSAFQVIDRDGVRGTLDLTVIPPQGSNSHLVLVRFEDGSSIFADASTFVEREKSIYSFPGSFAGLLKQNPAEIYGTSEFAGSGQIVVPLLAEELRITREKVLTGGVRVHKTVNERTEAVNEPVYQEQIEIERVNVNRFVDEPPLTRYEGDVMIVPLLEEVLVIEKKLVLREEIRISKRRDTSHHQEEVVLRSEDATLEQITPDERQAETPPVTG